MLPSKSSRVRGLQQLRHEASVALQRVETSQTRDQIRVPFINRQILTHWSCYLLFTCNEIETQRDWVTCLRWEPGLELRPLTTVLDSLSFSSLAPVTV